MSQTARSATCDAPDCDFAEAVIAGLTRQPRAIPCRFLYDAQGSKLFEQITGLDEYYPTRTEIALLRRHAAEIAGLAGRGATLVEFGSGSSRKTEILIEALADLRAYVPIDISASALDDAAERLIRRFPALNVRPLAADFNADIALPEERDGGPLLGFFPGSTIGNFDRAGAVGFLERARAILGARGALVIGVDLKKDEEILLRAYDDDEGVTAAFMFNLLRRINRELAGTFRLDRFRYEALYNDAAGRVEMYLTSQSRQTVSVLGRQFSLGEGERIHAENSHKYSLKDFVRLAGEAGWSCLRSWSDEARLFSLHYLIPRG